MKAYSTRIIGMMQEQGIDMTLVQSPENFAYVSGFSSHQHTVSRQPHFAAAILFADAEVRPSLIGMDFEVASFDSSAFSVHSFSTWVGNLTLEEINNSVVDKDFVTLFERLRQIVGETGLADKVIGIEMDFCPMAYYQQLSELFPNAKFVNVSPLFLQARSIKQQDEITFMRELACISDQALNYTSQFVKEGVSEKELFDIYCAQVMSSKRAFPSGWSSFTAGEQAGKLGRSNERIVKSIDIVKFDGGVNGDTKFYTTDFSRSWLMGSVDPFLVKIKRNLVEAHELMLGAIRPGLAFNDLFSIGYEYTKREFPFYTRGHLGHSISLGPQTAEAPFISAAQPGVCEAGMILAVENPLYITGYNGFNIEDMVLVTETGCENLTSLTPHWLESEAKYR